MVVELRELVARDLELRDVLFLALVLVRLPTRRMFPFGIAVAVVAPPRVVLLWSPFSAIAVGISPKIGTCGDGARSPGADGSIGAVGSAGSVGAVGSTSSNVNGTPRSVSYTHLTLPTKA